MHAHPPSLNAAIELTAAMWKAADAEDWTSVATLAGARHRALEEALRDGVAGLDFGAIDQLRSILAADQQLAARAYEARQLTAAALRDLHDGQRMRSAYDAQALVG